MNMQFWFAFCLGGATSMLVAVAISVVFIHVTNVVNRGHDVS